MTRGSWTVAIRRMRLPQGEGGAGTYARAVVREDWFAWCLGGPRWRRSAISSWMP